MASAGTLYAELVPVLNLRQVQRELTTGLVGSSKETGARAGREMTSGIVATTRSAGADVSKRMSTELVAPARSAGAKAGAEISKSMSAEVVSGARRTGVRTGEQMAIATEESMAAGVRGIGSRLGRGMAVAGVGAGRRFGTSLRETAGEYIKTIGTTMAGFFAAEKGIEFVKGSIDAARDANRTNALTAAVIKSTGAAAGVTTAQVHSYAEELSKSTGITGDNVQSTENLLLTFKKIKDSGPNKILDETTKAALDMGTAMKIGPRAAALQLGKALNDPAQGMSRLTRSGVTFTKAQIAQVKAMQASGNILGAQKFILREVQSEFGGAAAAAANPIDKMKASWHQLEEEVGNHLVPIINVLANWVTTKLIPALISTGHWIARNIGWIKPLVVSLGAAAVVIKLIALATRGAALATEAWALVTKGAVAAQWLLNLAMDANPVLLIVTGIAALAAGMIYAYKHSTTFRNVMNDIGRVLLGIWNWVRTHWVLVVTILTGGFGFIITQVIQHWRGIATAFRTGIAIVRAIVSGFVGFFTAAWRGVVAAARTIWNAITAVFRTGVAVVSAVWRGLVGAARAVWSVVTSVFRVAMRIIWTVVRIGVAIIAAPFVLLWAGLKAGARLFSAVFAGIWRGIVRAVHAVWNTFAGPIRAVWNALTGWFRAVGRGFSAWAQGLWRGLVRGVHAIWNTFAGPIRAVWRVLSGWFSAAWRAFSGFVARVWRGWVRVAHVVWNTLSGPVRAVWNTLSRWFSAVWRAFSGFVSRIWRGWVRIAHAIWNTISGPVRAVWNTLSGWFHTGWHAFSGFVSRSWHGFTHTISSVWATITGPLKRVWNTLSGWFHTVWHAFSGWVSRAWHTIATAIPNAFRGIGSAMSSIWTKIKNAVVSGVNAVIGFINRNLIGSINWVLGKIGLPGIGSIPLVGGGGGGPIRHGQSQQTNPGGRAGGSHAAAAGGVLPGYTPGRDVYRARSPLGGLAFSGGEGILVPEAVRGLGAGFVHGVNAMFTGRSPGPGMRGGFAGGGVIGDILGSVSSFLTGGLSGGPAGGGVLNTLLDKGAGFIFDHILGPVAGAAGHIPPPLIGQFAKGTVLTLGKALKSWFTTKTNPITAAAGGGGSLIAYAKRFIGVPYVWGGEEPSGFDCSGFVKFVLNHFGIHPPRTAAEQKQWATPESQAAAQAGDEVFWGDPAHHTAFYLGGSRILEAPQPGDSVKIASLYDSPTFGYSPAVRKLLARQQPSGGGGGVRGSAAANRAIGMQIARAQGVDFNAMDYIAFHESGWDNTAQSPTSTAYGAFQFEDMTWPSYGGKTSDIRRQTEDFIKYSNDRYGGVDGALAYWKVHHNYDGGGSLRPGLQTVFNGTGRDETVLPPAESQALKQIAASSRQGDGGGRFTGNLYLDSGQLLGVVDGRIQRHSDEQDRQLGFGRIVAPR